MIDHNLKCIQIHISKTGGLSIRKALFGIDNTDRFMHIPPNNIQYEKYWNDYFTFTFVRNPFDRLLSAYSFTVDSHNPKSPLNRDFIRYLRNKNISFKDFVLNVLPDEQWKNIKRFKSIKEYFIGPDNNKFKYDHIGRFENLQEDYNKICCLLKIENPTNLPIINKSTNRKDDYRNYYTDEMVEIVNDIYKWEINNFDYKF